MLASSGLSPASAWSRVNAARATAHSMLSVGERHGVDVLAGLRQMGIRGGVAQEAGVEYARTMLKGVALGAPPPHTPIPYRSLPEEVTLRDMDTALRILGSVQPVGPDSLPSVALLDSLVLSAHQRRIQLREDPQDTIRHAERAARLDRWMMDTYRQLPNPGLAAGLRKALGL